MAEPVTVVGGQIGGLVAADALARAGRQVRLLLPERGVGGGFLPVLRDGRRLELGVRMLELGYEDDPTPPALDRYAPGFGGHRPYTALVREWATDLVGDRLRDVPAPKLVLDGQTHDDVYFTVDLTPLPAILGPARRDAVAAQAAQAAAHLGDAGVLGNLEDRTLQDASLANHGETFHRTLIAPLTEKFLAGGSARTLASWRRKVWMPLFWPRTVEQACNGGPAFVPKRRFETVADEGASAVVRALLDRLRADHRVTIESTGPLLNLGPAGADVDLALEGTGSVRAHRPILAVGPRELFNGVGHVYCPERARSVIAWLEVATPDPIALHHIVDADNPVARVSDSGPGVRPGTRVFCVELRHDLAAEDAADAARRGLVQAGVLDAVTGAVPVHSGAMNTFDAPTAATRDAHVAALAHLADMKLDALVLGGARAPGADSLNEQVVSGLAAAEART